MNRRFLPFSAAALCLAATAACAPVQSFSGFRPDYNNVAIADPEVGVDTRQTVLSRFGSPSTTAVFDQTAWYYVSAVQSRVAFYAPQISARQVMVVRFDENNQVSAVDKYGMERGRIVAYNDNVTPTRGRELGLVEQIFGSIGNSSPVGLGRDEEGGRPNRR
jgi:outer membrane protein assembly factor BamE (lipoprotein component of BamABCDE complex)